VGDITKPRSSGRPCAYIANPTNWRFNPKYVDARQRERYARAVLTTQCWHRGGGVNRLIHDAAGEGLLHAETKRLFSHTTPGCSYPVDLPPVSPLLVDEHVRCVIHVLGPNLSAAQAATKYECCSRLIVPVPDTTVWQFGYSQAGALANVRRVVSVLLLQDRVRCSVLVFRICSELTSAAIGWLCLRACHL